MKSEEIIEKKKLSYCIERTKAEVFRCYYTYKFSTDQWLEAIDDPSYFGISQNDLKEKVIEKLTHEFRTALNQVIFGDPAGRIYVENIEKPQHIKFVIPVGNDKKWWQFWKKSLAEKAIADLIAKYSEIKIPKDFFIPTKENDKDRKKD